MQVGPSANHGASTEPIAPSPPRPPMRPRDALDGLMEATLFPEIKRYRDHIVDILRVIDGTQIGRELLKDFRTLAARGKFPSIDCQPPQNGVIQDANRPHCLLLREDLLTAGAENVGVPPELDQAPSVVFRLTEIRNVLAADGKDQHFRSPLADATDATDVRMDPVDTCVRFRTELTKRVMHEHRLGTVDANNARVTPPAPIPFDKGHAKPPVLPPASNPYGSVTENAGTGQAEQPVGGPRRVLRWAGQQIQAAKDFFLRRRDDSDTTTNVDGSPERPIIRVVKANHRRNPSIRLKREVDSDQVRMQADASPRTGDRTNGR